MEAHLWKPMSGQAARRPSRVPVVSAPVSRLFVRACGRVRDVTASSFLDVRSPERVDAGSLASRLQRVPEDGADFLRFGLAMLAPSLLRKAASQPWSTQSSCSPFLPCFSHLGRFGTLRTKEDCSALRPRRRRMCSRAKEPLAACATSFCSERCGQASVEAAVFVPVFMLLLALLLQPVFLLYTRSVMQQAAAEGVRVLATREASGNVSDEACEQYVLRRLGAVPNVAAFHTGSWEVEVEGDAAGEASVKVVGRLRPLPLLGVGAQLFGEAEGDLVVLRVEASGGARPSWLKGGYGDWVSIWK